MLAGGLGCLKLSLVLLSSSLSHTPTPSSTKDSRHSSSSLARLDASERPTNAMQYAGPNDRQNCIPQLEAPYSGSCVHDGASKKNCSQHGHAVPKWIPDIEDRINLEAPPQCQATLARLDTTVSYSPYKALQRIPLPFRFVTLV